MNRPHYILLPVNSAFILLSLAGAFLLNLQPLGGWTGVPDFVALVLVFWSVHQPRKVGIGVAFLMGLLMDVHDAALLGEGALAYTLLSYFAITIHRRVLWVAPLTQIWYILPLLLMTQLVQMVVQLLVSSKMPGWMFFLESFVSAALWPLMTWLLLAPQRRAINRDDTRPL
ncbi:MAG: rod shape-determining protein MreD [Oxalobacteraceae bacterium]